ncbi:hypothetical protein CTAM01_16155 [Colletotrichum tamarilloi]|nr:uncharacterized protein CTAM01_16155 [Colletotrichum tamarilloi]KAK1473249.1 hypothetical protein CTAM01_16155 [Colletotrichum tamarilloi]
MSGIPCRFHWCGHKNPTLPTRAVWPFDEGAKDKQGAEQALKSGPLHNQCWRDSPTFFSKSKSLSTNGLPHSFSGGSGCVPVGEESASWWESGSFATDIPYYRSQRGLWSTIRPGSCPTRMCSSTNLATTTMSGTGLFGRSVVVRDLSARKMLSTPLDSDLGMISGRAPKSDFEIQHFRCLKHWTLSRLPMQSRYLMRALNKLPSGRHNPNDQVKLP